MHSEFNTEKILVVFKTHLDVGFTDFAGNVIDKYVNEFIPNAVALADSLAERKDNVKFRWTTGSWLICEYLKRAPKEAAQKLEKSIKEGKICYHALPFTTHTEIMTKDIFNYGLSLFQGLDKKFKKKTIAAKMTDVPGHTKAMIPLLKKAGVEFLHIGVNDACPMPAVPPIFRWREGDDEIIVMYNDCYGTFTQIEGTGTAVYFAHTNDNKGGPSKMQVIKLFNKLKGLYPKAQITAADLNDVAAAVLPVKDTLPVVTQEIGDTWIHGAGTDPRKVFNYKRMAEFAGSVYNKKDADAIYNALLLTAEHTWGLDEKTHLKDNVNYAFSDFHRVKNNKNYQKMELSWQEKRNYILDAVAEQNLTNKKRAEDILSGYCRRPSETVYFEKLENYAVHTGSFPFTLRFNEKGAVSYLSVGGKVLADARHPLGMFMYEQFSVYEYDRYFRQYNVRPYDWALEDYTKIGMESGSKEYRSCNARLLELYRDGNRFIAQLGFGDDLVYLPGCPAAAEMTVTVNEHDVEFDFAWFDKKANRVAEAMWLRFCPVAATAKVSKLGLPVDPLDVIDNGNKKLFGTDFGAIYDTCSIEAKDSLLVAFGKPSLLNFDNVNAEKVCDSYFNLYNNIWGTNFPMWYGEDARFRFKLSF